MDHLTPMRAIRIYCLACQGSFKSVKNCSSVDCSLYIYRFGHNSALRGKRGKGNPQALIDWRLKKTKPSMALGIENRGIPSRALNLLYELQKILLIFAG